MYVCMYVWMDGWMDGWIDGWMDVRLFFSLVVLVFGPVCPSGSHSGPLLWYMSALGGPLWAPFRLFEGAFFGFGAPLWAPFRPSGGLWGPNPKKIKK